MCMQLASEHCGTISGKLHNKGICQGIATLKLGSLRKLGMNRLVRQEERIKEQKGLHHAHWRSTHRWSSQRSR